MAASLARSRRSSVDPPVCLHPRGAEPLDRPLRLAAGFGSGVPWRASVPIERKSPGTSVPAVPSYQRDIAALKNLYQENAELETIRVKRRLWYDLLRTALGEIAYTTEGMSEEAQARLAAGRSRPRGDGRSVRAPHLPERRHWHGRAVLLRHRHPAPSRNRPSRPAPGPGTAPLHRVVGSAGTGLLRLAQRVRRQPPTANSGPPGCPV